jgi:3-hydroxyacyl-CoA dehydrogenase/enoyl-CoA hydratase/3-hydroxybutyryl-CoA epimerase
MLLGGKRLGVREAREWGLVDQIADAGDTSLPALTHDPRKRTLPFLPFRTWRQWWSESTKLGRSLILRGAGRVLKSRLPEDMPAPKLALEAVEAGLRRGAEGGLARVREAVVELAESEACRNLLRLHAQRDKFRAVSAEGQEGRPRAVGVIGGGRRATALIYLLLTKGYQVVIHEASDAALGAVLFQMLSIFQKEVASGAMAQPELAHQLRNIRGTTAWKGFDEVDLVLDTGDEPTRAPGLFQELERQTAPHAILVATAPGARVSELQRDQSHPERIAGLHVLTPVNRSLLIEVVSSDKTAADSGRRLQDFVVSLGRVPWPVHDRPGLLIERLLLPYLNEAILLVKEGLDPRRVDEAMVRFGAVGPLEFLDVVGLDVVASLIGELAPILAPRIAFDDVFAFMASRKWLGQTAGVGFYRHRRKKRRVNQQLVAHLRGKSHAEAPHTREAMSRADQLTWARRRLVFLVINEAAWCLKEERADSAASLDLAVMLIGWAPHRGGPLHYAQHLGVDNVLAELEELAAEHGPRYEPCPALLAALGRASH